MYDDQSQVFPEIGFPYDFKDKAIEGSRVYDLDFLITRGFVVIYTIIGNEEGYKIFAKQLTKSIADSMKKVLIIKLNKPSKEFFNETLFKWYDIIRGTKVLGYIPLQILIFTTQISQLFHEGKHAIYTETQEIKVPNQGSVYFIVLSNKKEFTRGPLLETILNNHQDKLKDLISKFEKKKNLENIQINNYGGILSIGDNVSINNNILKHIYFESIYEEIKKRNPNNKTQLLKIIKKIESEGRIKQYMDYLRLNASWILPLVDIALRLSGK